MIQEGDLVRLRRVIDCNHRLSYIRSLPLQMSIRTRTKMTLRRVQPQILIDNDDPGTYLLQYRCCEISASTCG